MSDQIDRNQRIPIDDNTEREVITTSFTKNTFNCCVCEKKSIPFYLCKRHVNSPKHYQKFTQFTRENPMSLIKYNSFQATNELHENLHFITNSHPIIQSDSIAAIKYYSETLFYCFTCNALIDEDGISHHLTSTTHCLRFLKQTFPSAYFEIIRRGLITCLPQIQSNFELHFGRRPCHVVDYQKFAVNFIEIKESCSQVIQMDEFSSQLLEGIEEERIMPLDLQPMPHDTLTSVQSMFIRDVRSLIRQYHGLDFPL